MRTAPSARTHGISRCRDILARPTQDGLPCEVDNKRQRKALAIRDLTQDFSAESLAMTANLGH